MRQRHTAIAVIRAAHESCSANIASELAFFQSRLQISPPAATSSLPVRLEVCRLSTGSEP